MGPFFADIYALKPHVIYLLLYYIKPVFIFGMLLFHLGRELAEKSVDLVHFETTRLDRHLRYAALTLLCSFDLVAEHLQKT